jgi:hypothetical protein
MTFTDTDTDTYTDTDTDTDAPTHRHTDTNMKAYSTHIHTHDRQSDDGESRQSQRHRSTAIDSMPAHQYCEPPRKVRSKEPLRSDVSTSATCTAMQHGAARGDHPRRTQAGNARPQHLSEVDRTQDLGLLRVGEVI